MLNEDIKLGPGSARRARALLRRRLADLGVDGDHILSVELVVAELVAAALEQEGDVEHRSGHLSLELFPLLTSVRLRCPHDVELVDEPYALRDRMLGRLTVAVGRRSNTDGTTELWAEVAHPVERVS